MNTLYYDHPFLHPDVSNHFWIKSKQPKCVLTTTYFNKIESHIMFSPFRFFDFHLLIYSPKNILVQFFLHFHHRKSWYFAQSQCIFCGHYIFTRIPAYLKYFTSRSDLKSKLKASNQSLTHRVSFEFWSIRILLKLASNLLCVTQLGK